MMMMLYSVFSTTFRNKNSWMQEYIHTFDDTHSINYYTLYLITTTIIYYYYWVNASRSL